MTDELEILRPEVADAVSALDETTCMTNPGLKWYATIRAELLRLAKAEFDLMLALQDRLGAQDEYAVVAKGWQERAEKAEAELAALKARIAEAPEYRCEADIISGRDGDYISAVLIHDDNAFQYPDVDGKRVRLLVEE